MLCTITFFSHGEKLGNKPDDCPVTEDYGSRILRLPLYYDLDNKDIEVILEMITDYFNK